MRWLVVVVVVYTSLNMLLTATRQRARPEGAGHDVARDALDMRKPVVLITGAGGEIGHGLVTRLSAAAARRSSPSTSVRSTRRSRRS